ncbi:hypothetical protein V5F89_11955 [Pelagerythrobacter marensis]|uniref:Uncharacterized protein n=1 Tax=Pelagerythrobacter marensis TaxID=543877 RepID=A0ABZ2D1N7_9SPHN
MKRDFRYSDIPIRSAVIAWQPAFLPRFADSARVSEVAVLREGDRRERQFGMIHGACWCDWAEQSVEELIDTLDWLKGVMVSEHGIAPHRIKAAFANIPEYRQRQTRQGRASL